MRAIHSCLSLTGYPVLQAKKYKGNVEKHNPTEKHLSDTRMSPHQASSVDCNRPSSLHAGRLLLLGITNNFQKQWRIPRRRIAR